MSDPAAPPRPQADDQQPPTAWPMFGRVWRRADLLDRMLERLGIGAGTAVRLDGGRAFLDARGRCLACTGVTDCRARLEPDARSDPPPEFCPNRDYFDRCRQLTAQPPAPVAAPGCATKYSPATATAAADQAFEVWLVWSDRRLQVPAGRSALDVLTEAGVPVEPGCQTGGCGSCALPYVEGHVIHKDACLSAEDRKRQFCPCVSRALGTLALPF